MHKLTLALAVALIAGCGVVDDDLADMTADATDTTATATGIEVAGTWLTQFMTTEVVDDMRWDFMTIVEFDNDTNVAITQNPSDDMFNPDAFNRLVWTELDTSTGTFAYCTVAFGLATADEARNSTATADESDLDTGCGGFSWTQMTAVQ